MNRRRYLNYISTLNTLQDTNINFKRLIPTAVYNNSRPHNNKNLIGDININITLPSGFVAQNTEAPFDRSIRQEPISEVFEQQNIPDEPPIQQEQEEPVILDNPENRNIIFEQERLRRRMERERLLEERETRSIARRQRNAEAENRRRVDIDPDNELIVPVLPAGNDPTESEIEIYRGRLQDLQGNQEQSELRYAAEQFGLSNVVTNVDGTMTQLLTPRNIDFDQSLGDVRLSGSESDSTGSNEFLLGIGYAETPTRPNTPSINHTPLQGVGMDIIQERDYFDTDNF